jgi:hypothetical protein
MRIGKTRIYLKSGREFDGGFANFSGLEVTLAALKIFLFPDVGIPGTTKEQRSRKNS